MNCDCGDESDYVFMLDGDLVYYCSECYLEILKVDKSNQ